MLREAVCASFLINLAAHSVRITAFPSVERRTFVLARLHFCNVSQLQLTTSLHLTVQREFGG
jgi:hypothetical protein